MMLLGGSGGGVNIGVFGLAFCALGQLLALRGQLFALRGQVLLFALARFF